MDKIGADYFNCVSMIKDRTGANALPINIPIGSENNFEGIVNLITMKEWVWKSEDLGASWEIRDIRPELQNKADELRAQLIETAVEQDDEWTEKFLEGEEPSVDDLHILIRKGTLSMSFVPVLCASEVCDSPAMQPVRGTMLDGYGCTYSRSMDGS